MPTVYLITNYFAFGDSLAIVRSFTSTKFHFKPLIKKDTADGGSLRKDTKWCPFLTIRKYLITLCW